LSLVFAVNVSAGEIIHAGRLLDVENAKVLTEQTIYTDGERIVRIEGGYTGGDQAIDLTDHLVMPGWIDMHVHIATQLSPNSYEERFRLNPEDYAIRSVRHAKLTLMAGFTTVRDLGTAYDVAQSLRNNIRLGVVPGPRIFTAGTTIATTGGHGDASNGVGRELERDLGPADGVVNSVADAYKAVRARYKDGSDLIKITATGGVLSQAKSGMNAQFTVEEIQAIVAAAKDNGFKVAAHAHGTEGMRRAVVGGVNSIEHGTFMTPEVMKLMRKKGTWYVPTILAGMFVAEKAKTPGYFSELVRPKAIAIGPQIKDTFAAAYKAGVKIAFGTDTGVSAHGDNWQEFLHMVDAGMSPMEAFIAATKSAAELLDQSDDMGSITEGKYADIIAIQGDPLTDISLVENVSFVMKGGTVHKR
jgi:imidazolonepropionase-like amidohydrolase